MRDFLPPSQIPAADFQVPVEQTQAGKREIARKKFEPSQLGEEVSNIPEQKPVNTATATPSLMTPQVPNLGLSGNKMAQASNLAELGATQEAKAYEEQAAQGEAITKTYDQKQADLQQKQERERNDFMQKVSEVDNDIDTFKIDPNKMWANMSTGNKVLAGLSIFLGGFDPSGQNKALGIIDNAINRDIDAQKLNYQKLVGKKQGLNTTYGYMMDKFKNEDIAMSAARGAQFHALSLKVQEMAAKAKIPQVKASYLEKAAAIDQQAQKNAIDTMMKLQELQQKTSSKTVRGFEGVSNASEANTDKFKEESSNAIDIIKNIKEIKKSVGSFSSLPGKEKEVTRTKIKMVIGQLKDQLLGPGPLSEGEREYMLDLIGDPTSLFSLSSSNIAKLDTISNSIISKVNNKAMSYGLKPMSGIFDTPIDLEAQKRHK